MDGKPDGKRFNWDDEWDEYRGIQYEIFATWDMGVSVLIAQIWFPHGVDESEPARTMQQVHMNARKMIDDYVD